MLLPDIAPKITELVDIKESEEATLNRVEQALLQKAADIRDYSPTVGLQSSAGAQDASAADEGSTEVSDTSDVGNGSDYDEDE